MPVLVQTNLNFPVAEDWRTGRESYLKSNSAWRTFQGLEGAWLLSVFRKMGKGLCGEGPAGCRDCKQQQPVSVDGREGHPLTQAGEGEQ